MARFLPSSYRRVLEIGCAAGSFSDHLSLPCEVWGVEPNAEAAQLAARKMHKVLVGTYDLVAAELPERYFDLVVCNDVIEHMDDHEAFLEAIKQKMVPGGYITGSIPNVRHITALFKLLIRKDWPYADSGILDRTHLRFFTEKSLRRALLQHGYRIEKFAGIGSIIRSGIASVPPPGFLADAVYRLATIGVVCLTAGFYWDTQYPQYGFLVSLA
jgi:2-polyprenyl-3-methyl-5-hydroxy-6-metoxy-1,4-benzoquinol methylase